MIKVSIPAHSIVEVMRQGFVVTSKLVSHGLPDDARLVDVDYLPTSAGRQVDLYFVTRTDTSAIITELDLIYVDV